MVGANYMLGYVLWGKYFIESLGYTVQSNVLFQENKLTMILEKNGVISNGKRTKYIKDCYLLIVDEIEKRELEIQHFAMEHI